MKIFNLLKFQNQAIEDYVRMQVEAMAVPQWNRPRYDWWDLEDLLKGGDERWNELCASNPNINKDLNRLFVDAQRIRVLWLKKMCGDKWYRAELKDAIEMIQTYIGYDPKYGGYIAQLGPYMSSGYKWGPEHKKEKAEDKFGYYIWRRQKAQVPEIAAHIAENVQNYKGQYGLDLNGSDFKMIVKTSAASEEGIASKGKRKEVDEVIESLDFNDPITQEKFKNNPPMMGGGGAEIRLNAQGISKIEKHNNGQLMKDFNYKLQKTFPKEYEICLQKRAIDEKKPIEIVRQEMLTSFNTLRKVWTNVRNMANIKLKDPNADKTGMPVDPKTEKLIWPTEPLKTYSKPGQQQFSTISDSKNLVDILDLRLEVLGVVSKLYEMYKNKKPLSDGRIVNEKMINDPELIAQILNEDAKRLPIAHTKDIAQDIEKQIDKRHSMITPDEVTRQLALINVARTRKGKQPKTYGQLVAETMKIKAETIGTLGYDDQDTTREAMALHLSGQKIDRVTRARIGGTNDILFNPQEKEDKTNHNSEFLKQLRTTKEIRYPETAGEIEFSEEAGEKTDKELEKPEKIELKNKKLIPEILEDKPIEKVEPILGTPSELPSKDIKEPILTPEIKEIPVIPDTKNVKNVKNVKVAPEKTKKTEKSTKKPEPKKNIPKSPKSEPKPELTKNTKKPTAKPKITKKPKDLVSSTLTNLIKVAENLDKEGKYYGAEEIHKIIRKYQERL